MLHRLRTPTFRRVTQPSGVTLLVLGRGIEEVMSMRRKAKYLPLPVCPLDAISGLKSSLRQLCQRLGGSGNRPLSAISGRSRTTP